MNERRQLLDDAEATVTIVADEVAPTSVFRSRSGLIALAFLVCTLGLLAVGLSVGLLVGGDVNAAPTVPTCTGSGYNYTLVESIPMGLERALPYPSGFGDSYNHTTAVAWSSLIAGAQRSIDIVCFYMTLNATDDGSPATSPEQDVQDGHVVGTAIYEQLIAAAQRGVRIRIVESYPTTTVTSPSLDVQRLVDGGYAEARTLNMTALLGAGIVHSKLLLFDDSSFYVGSANLDWRSLTQVKELGVVLFGGCLFDDMQRQFRFFWDAAERSRFPTPVDGGDYASKYWALFDAARPAHVRFGNDPPGQPPSHVYLTSSPPSFCPRDRTFDLDAIESLLAGATSTVCISVMDYIPAVVYSTPQYYWPDIDDAIRAAAFDGVQVRMLISLWNYTSPQMHQYLLSLDALDNVVVNYMIIPPQPGVAAVPYTRVNHAKYMVTDAAVLISTSNWSGDYFIDTTGSSAVSNDPNMIAQVQQIFDRDWSSSFAYPVTSNDLPPYVVVPGS